MNGEDFSPEFYKNFYFEELYSVTEAAKLAPTGTILNKEVNTEIPIPASTEKNAEEAKLQPIKVLPFTTKGGNKKKVAVLLNLFDHDFENLTEQKLLMAILGAIKLGPDDVAFVNITGQVNDLSEIASEVDFENAILFLNPKHSLITHHKLKPFQPMSVHKKYVIAGAELSALQSYKDQKAQLWTGLQAMFL